MSVALHIPCNPCSVFWPRSASPGRHKLDQLKQIYLSQFSGEPKRGRPRGKGREMINHASDQRCIEISRPLVLNHSTPHFITNLHYTNYTITHDDRKGWELLAWEPLEICAQVYPFQYPVSTLDLDT